MAILIENFIHLNVRPWVLNNAVITDLDQVQFFQNIWARLFLKYIMQAKKEVLGSLLTDLCSQCKNIKSGHAVFDWLWFTWQNSQHLVKLFTSMRKVTQF